MLLASRTRIVLLALVAVASAQHTWIVGSFAERGAVYNSTGWFEPLNPTDFDAAVTSVATSGNDCKLYLGGGFTSGVKSFDGLATEELSTAGSVGGSVNAMVFSGASLYLGGSFDSAGSLDVAGLNLVSYSGSTFLQVGSAGVDGAVNGLAADGGSLYIGGAFTTLGADYTARAGAYSFIDEAIASLGTGTAVNTYPIQSGAVNSVAVFGGSEYFGCVNCQLEGAVATNGLAIYTGNSMWRGTSIWTGATVNANGLAAGDDVLMVVGSGGNCGVMVAEDAVNHVDMPNDATGCTVFAGTPTAVTWVTGNTFRVVDSTGALYDVEYDDGTWATTQIVTSTYVGANAIVVTTESVGQSSLCSAMPVAGSAMTPSMLLVAALAAFLAVLF